MATNDEQQPATDADDADPLPAWVYHVPALVLTIGGFGGLAVLSFL